MPFPIYRPRRLRESPLLRSMVRETALRVDDFVYPLFAVHGRGVREPIASVPGQHRLSVDELLKECKDAASMGIPAVLLAAYVVKSLPLVALRWGVVVVVLYAAALLLYTAFKAPKPEPPAAQPPVQP